MSENAGHDAEIVDPMIVVGAASPRPEDPFRWADESWIIRSRYVIQHEGTAVRNVDGTIRIQVDFYIARRRRRIRSPHRTLRRLEWHAGDNRAHPFDFDGRRLSASVVPGVKLTAKPSLRPSSAGCP